MSDYGNNRNTGGPQQQANRPAPIKHALNDFRFRLMGRERLEGAPKPPTLGFNIVKDGVALNAYTNVQGDDDNGRISGELPLQELFLFIDMLRGAARLAPGTHEEMAIAANEFNRQSNKREVRPRLSLKVGKNDAGVVYLAVASWKRSRPVVMIEMLPSNLIRLVDGQGNPAPADKVSERYASAWAQSLATLVPVVLNSHYIPPKDLPPRDGQAAGGGGYGGGQGGGGNSYGGGGNNYGGQRPAGGGYQQQAPAGNQGGYQAPSGGGGFAGGGMDDLPM